ncbi:MAG: hypothetical protein ACOCQ1_04925 [Halanaerobiaceae bacterium]
MYKKDLKKQGGFSLVIVFVVLLVIGILSLALMKLAASEIKQVNEHENREQAHSYSRSGAELAYQQIKEGLKLVGDENEQVAYTDIFDDIELKSTSTSWISEGEVEVEIKESGFEDQNNNDVEKDDLEKIDKISVDSRGMARGVTCKLGEYYTLEYPVFPPEMWDYVDEGINAKDMGWVSSGGSGVINSPPNSEGNEEESYYFRGSGNSLKVKKSVEFTGKAFYFDEAEEKYKNKGIKNMQFNTAQLKLNTDSVVFYMGLEFDSKAGAQTSSICLAPDSDDEVVRVHFADNIYFERKSYQDGKDTFPAGTYEFDPDDIPDEQDVPEDMKGGNIHDCSDALCLRYYEDFEKYLEPYEDDGWFDLDDWEQEWGRKNNE